MTEEKINQIKWTCNGPNCSKTLVKNLSAIAGKDTFAGWIKVTEARDLGGSLKSHFCSKNCLVDYYNSLVLRTNM